MPRARASGELLVGVFGGSLAFRLQSKDSIGESLRQRPEFEDLEVTVLNLALPGYKQPQQLFSLVYWFTRGGEFDIVINIDGFNEVALHRTENALKNVAAIYPRRWYTRVQDLPDPTLRRLVGRISFLEETRRELARETSASPLSLSLTANLIWKLRDRKLVAQLGAAEGEFLDFQPETTSLEASGPRRDYADDDEMYAHLAEIWERASLQMDRLCLMNGAEYFQFVQPNQYFPGSKVIGPKERRIAFREDYEHRVDVEQGYPLLLEGVEALALQQVRAYDSTQVFVDVAEPAYMDACCHLNEFGNRLLAHEIAAIVASDAKVLALVGN